MMSFQCAAMRESMDVIRWLALDIACMMVFIYVIFSLDRMPTYTN